mmetsp:Transcript_14497/g.37307  ORF Transcript_14497/g.37307 Transcript_14497/m.37307 type:complete len:217 (+) Transcript_14497:648-1298(+)
MAVMRVCVANVGHEVESAKVAKDAGGASPVRQGAIGQHSEGKGTLCLTVPVVHEHVDGLLHTIRGQAGRWRGIWPGTLRCLVTPSSRARGAILKEPLLDAVSMVPMAARLQLQQGYSITTRNGSTAKKALVVDVVGHAAPVASGRNKLLKPPFFHARWGKERPNSRDEFSSAPNVVAIPRVDIVFGQSCKILKERLILSKLGHMVPPLVWDVLMIL